MLFILLHLQCSHFCFQGYHGIQDEVYLSLPSVIGAGGVTDVIVQQLTDDERKMLHKSASIMAEVQSSLKL